MTGAARYRQAGAYVGLGLVFYLLFLLATAPAVWLAEAATRVSSGAVTLARPSGTIWNGTGELRAGSAASGVRELGTLKWRIEPWWFILGRAQFTLRLDGPMAQGRAGIAFAPRRYVKLEDLDATVPANIASLVYAPAAFFEPTGKIAVRSQQAELSGDGLEAKVEVQWQGAGGRFTGPKPLGDYRIDLTGAGETAALRLSTLRGDLELNGQGQWQIKGDGALRFTGTARPRGDAGNLEPLLRTLGRDLGGGRREIRFNGRFPLVRQLGFS